MTVTEPIRFVPRLYDFQKKETITMPHDFLVEAETQMPITLTFDNISKSSLESLSFVIRAYSNIRFGNEKVQGPLCNEYIGVAAEKLSNLTSGSTFTPTFLKVADVPISQVMEELFKPPNAAQTATLTAKVENILKQNEPVPIDLQVNFTYTLTDTPGEAVFKPGRIQMLSIPSNLGSNYNLDSLIIHLRVLHHKSAKKRTRVVIHVLDISKKQYVKCFKGTQEKEDFTSVVQKGSMDMEIDEFAHIDLNYPGFDLSQSYLVFEVTRPSRSKGSNHLSSCSFYKITDAEGKIEAKDGISLTYKSHHQKQFQQNIMQKSFHHRNHHQVQAVH